MSENKNNNIYKFSKLALIVQIKIYQAVVIGVSGVLNLK